MCKCEFVGAEVKVKEGGGEGRRRRRRKRVEEGVCECSSCCEGSRVYEER